MPREIAFRPGIGATAQIEVGRELQVSRITVERPALIVVRKGKKRLSCGTREWVVGAGEAVAVAGGSTFDATDTPATTGPYEAAWLSFDPLLVAEYPVVGENVAEIRGPLKIAPMESPFREAFERAVETIRDPGRLPQSIAVARMREVLAWLGVAGGRFVVSPVLSTSTRARHLIATNPAQEWDAAAVASQLAMSEPTLRRRLSAEGGSFRDLLTEVRMSRALILLQSTEVPIVQVALAVGYESPSRFAARFKVRFGSSPSDFR